MLVDLKGSCCNESTRCCGKNIYQIKRNYSNDYHVDVAFSNTNRFICYASISQVIAVTDPGFHRRGGHQPQPSPNFSQKLHEIGPGTHPWFLLGSTSERSFLQQRHLAECNMYFAVSGLQILPKYVITLRRNLASFQCILQTEGEWTCVPIDILSYLPP